MDDRNRTSNNAAVSGAVEFANLAFLMQIYIYIYIYIYLQIHDATMFFSSSDDLRCMFQNFSSLVNAIVQKFVLQLTHGGFSRGELSQVVVELPESLVWHLQWFNSKPWFLANIISNDKHQYIISRYKQYSMRFLLHGFLRPFCVRSIWNLSSKFQWKNRCPGCACSAT